jgi:hypothetical protein
LYSLPQPIGTTTEPFPPISTAPSPTLADPRDDARAAIIAAYARVIGSLQLLLDTHRNFLHGPLTAPGDAFCNDIVAGVKKWFPHCTTSPSVCFAPNSAMMSVP